MLSKLRDIYLQAHSLKLYMNCVGEHYKEAQRHVQPASNPGFRAAGSAQRAALVIGLQREEAVGERRAWHRGLCDKGGFFQSIPRRVQQAVEASSGVPAPITSSVLALHDTLRWWHGVLSWWPEACLEIARTPAEASGPDAPLWLVRQACAQQLLLLCACSPGLAPELRLATSTQLLPLERMLRSKAATF